MSTWILIWLFGLRPTQMFQVSMQEFNSEETCKNAKEVILSKVYENPQYMDTRYNMVECVKK